MVNFWTLLYTTQNIQVCKYTGQFLNGKKPEKMHYAVSLFIKIIIIIKIILQCITNNSEIYVAFSVIAQP